MITSVSAASDTRLRSLFATASASKTQITLTEFTALMKSLEITLTPNEATAMLKKLDKDGDGLISYEEFRLLFDQANLKKVFDSIDTANDGSISPTELDAAFKKLDIHISPAKLNELIKIGDVNNDGQIDFDEFVTLFGTIPLVSLKQVAQRWLSITGCDVGSDFSFSQPPKGNELPLWLFVLAGGLGGVVSRTATAPFETVKILMQTSNPLVANLTTTQSFRKIYNTSGMRGLFRGNLSNCLRVFPFGGICCLTYASICKVLPVDEIVDWTEPFYRSIAGATAGMVATLSTHPLDTVRARLTVQSASAANNQYTGISNAFSTIVKEEGVRHGLYKGIRPTLVAIMPFVAAQQAIYDFLRFSSTSHLGYAPSVPLFLTIGGIAGLGAQSIVYPLDLARRKIQVDATTHLGHRRVMGVLKGIVKNEGARGLFRGIIPSFLKVAPSCAISLVVRDAVLGRLD